MESVPGYPTNGLSGPVQPSPMTIRPGRLHQKERGGPCQPPLIQPPSAKNGGKSTLDLLYRSMLEKGLSFYQKKGAATYHGRPPLNQGN